MQEKTIQVLPASPLSLVSYVESKFYVRSAYRKIWDCITRTEGKLRLQILAACYETPVANMKLIMQFC